MAEHVARLGMKWYSISLLSQDDNFIKIIFTHHDNIEFVIITLTKYHKHNCPITFKQHYTVKPGPPMGP